ncbi:lycopene cyclase family protein [Flavobacterium azooxidireducens]|uniref:Lycopene cyclase family protein n=1 Tax=Flavobacterium azooxidireducens TaxID=1871076 RepID=A0ABY4KI86_9FLAO|nr:lycopene cyclase family protein [Flavobacterium azooxidireducens]UPQ80506.1 lycopene cyclase family protein [Flavobacterium azooxidireducens]
MSKKYDYIILGSGLSGLLTAFQMANDPWFNDKSILIIDKEIKNQNDRTWCFWEEPNGEFDSILSKTWEKAFIGNQDFQQSFDMHPYLYKMIRSSDFYKLVFDTISSKSNFAFINDEIIHWKTIENSVEIQGKNQTYTSNFLLNSFFDVNPILNQKKYPYLKQHFIGWFIKTKEAIFDDSEVKFMDFTIEQDGNTRFMYVLPNSKSEALFEYTLFSEDLLEKSLYKKAIQNYLQNLGITDYEIVEKEAGNIPMTCFPFHKQNSERILFIGTAGGWTKASTGFTFFNSKKQSEKLVGFLKTNQNLSKFHQKNRYWFYDLILLEVLHQNNELGAQLFGTLFQKNSIQNIFKFLNEEGTIYSDLKVMLTLPKWLFIKATFRALWKLV